MACKALKDIKPGKAWPPLAPGLYFGLSAERYHSDPALSRSDIVNLLDTPHTYWSRSWMNPDRKRISNEAMEYGEAFHCLLFEPKKFERQYQVVPIDQWAEEKKKITYDEYMAIVESIKVLRAGKDSNLFLSGGYPEVTIVFEDNGVLYRARHDYMSPVMTSDFKTAWSLHERHIQREFETRGLDVQLSLYSRSRVRFKEQFAAGEADVYGDVEKKWFDRFMADQLNEFVFIFQRKTPPYPYLPLMPEQDTEQSGAEKIFRATHIWQTYIEKYGLNPWPVCEGKMKPFSMFYGVKEGN